MDTLSYLSDVIGPRLTGSPNLKRAYEWTQSKFTSWGLTNAHLEPWGPFGRGWEVKRFSAQVIEPQCFPIIAFPQGWSPGYDAPKTADVVFIDPDLITNLDQLNQYKGELQGSIVMISRPVNLPEPLQPLATRLTDSNLLNAANTPDELGFFGTPLARNGAGGGTGRRGGPGSQFGTNRVTAPRLLSFLMAEKAGVVVTISGAGIYGDPFSSGTVLVQSASVPPAPGAAGFAGGRGGPSVYSTNAPATLPQIVVAAESYNRMVRMIRAGEKLKMQVDLEVKFHDEDVMAYNTIAEIPGSDLKDEIVMLGGHMDSWSSGTGATDNGAGVAACMEAVRIIEAAGLHPRRTIRIALWTGEEQGLLGSAAYVSQHFGSNAAGPGGGGGRGRGAGRGGANRGGTNASPGTATTSTNAPVRRGFTAGPEYDKLSAYFNLDNGGGRIRGVFMEQNEAVRPLFRLWLEPFHSLGAETLTLSRTGSTDHVSFDRIGLPGFQFLQDPLDYFDHTHHTSQDVFDRISADDLKQAATILAAFTYDAAMLDQKLPRKPRN
jgi:carboxypeptidase Q